MSVTTNAHPPLSWVTATSKVPVTPTAGSPVRVVVKGTPVSTTAQ